MQRNSQTKNGSDPLTHTTIDEVIQFCLKKMGLLSKEHDEEADWITQDVERLKNKPKQKRVGITEENVERAR